MKILKVLAPLIFLTLSSAAVADESLSCQKALNGATSVRPSARDKLNISQAAEITGSGEVALQIRRALEFLASDSQRSFEEKVTDLRTLFWAIRIDHLFAWEYDEVGGPNKSTVFVDPTGQFVWIERGGRIFEGKMNSSQEISRRGIWSGRSNSLVEITTSKN